MFSAFFRKKERRIIAVADIGSGSAGVAIISLAEGSPAKILVAERLFLSHEDRSKMQTIAAITQVLGDAAEKALRRYAAMSTGEVVSAVYAVMHAPWTSSKTIRAHSRYEIPTTIQGGMITELSQRALAADPDHKKHDILEASIVRVELDGYPSADPEGRSASSLSIAILVSECEHSVRDSLKEVLVRAFPNVQPTFRSGIRAILAILRESEQMPSDCVVAEISSEATNLTVIRGGVASEHIAVPEGSRSVLRRIAGDTMPEEALTLMKMALHDQCETDACVAIKRSIAGVEPELTKIFGERLARISDVRRLPTPFFFVVEDDISLWVDHFFSRSDLTLFTVTARPFAPMPLGQHVLKDFVETKTLGDLGLAVAGALVNIETGSK